MLAVWYDSRQLLIGDVFNRSRDIGFRSAERQNNMVKRTIIAVAMLVMVGGFSSCAMFKKTPKTDNVVAAAEPAADHEAELRKMATREINENKGSKEQAEQRIIRRRPYYLREYSVYPTPEKLDVTLHETESRSQPMAAEVRVAKERYFTQMHRDHKVAENDLAFLRNIGTETISYELRSGHWRRTGSVFVAENTESEKGGKWSTVDEKAETQVPKTDKKPGWFSRTWHRVMGKD